MAKPKLTQTFKDAAQTNGGLAAGQPESFQPIPPINQIIKNHVVQPHEPLKGEHFQVVNSPFVAPPQLITKTDIPVAPAQKPLKIALVGTAPSSRLLAPYNDPSWTIWACSPGNQGQLPRADVWFEIHGNLLWPENKHYGEPYLEWLKQLQIPVYMQNQELVPNARVFPMDDMVKKFGRDFFTSSFAWMMAFAIDHGANEIALYGIDMASRNEYILQRPGFYFFKYMAEQKGIKVSAPNESDIMQPPGLYGYSDVRPLGRKILAREQEILGRLTQMRQQRDHLIQQITYLEGAAEDIDYFKSIWMGQG